MTASRLRLENASIFNFMKYEIISPAFSELSSVEDLVYDSNLAAYVAQSAMDPSPTSEGRGWVFFDDATVNSRIIVDTNSEQTTKVVVTGASTYTVNYLNGSIKNPDTTPTSVQYYWNYVSVLPSWPGTTPPPLPFVYMGIDANRKEGFQLGGGVRNLRTVSFDIFATTASERDDIADVVHSALFNRTITIRDFSGGGYLNYDGTFNSSVSIPPPNLGNLIFLDVTMKNIHVAGEWTDLHKYRSLVSGTYESLVDSS